MSTTDAIATLFGDADRRTPGSDEISRRIARLCSLSPGSRVLALGCGPGRTARILAREYGCNVVCLDEDPRAIELLKQRSVGDGVASRLYPTVGDVRSLSFADGEFDAVVVEGLSWGLPEAALAIRRVLEPRGRLAVSVPCRVGRTIPQAVSDFWAKKLGYGLGPPSELLQVVSRAGFEPLACEAMSDALVDEHYCTLEPGLARLDRSDGGSLASEARREIDVWRREGGRQVVTYALIVARRRELGEKLPATRNSNA